MMGAEILNMFKISRMHLTKDPDHVLFSFRYLEKGLKKFYRQGQQERETSNNCKVDPTQSEIYIFCCYLNNKSSQKFSET
jgi:hypothetical protein